VTALFCPFVAAHLVASELRRRGVCEQRQSCDPAKVPCCFCCAAEQLRSRLLTLQVLLCFVLDAVLQRMLQL
jgi:hypothetical protein